jgi:DNA-binding NtrC family response regulator
MCKILLVEDHPNSRKGLEQAFEACGAEVLSAPNLGVAMRLFDLHGPSLDAVVTDKHLDRALPFKEDSRPLLDRIAETRPGLYVVAMTVDEDKSFFNHPAVSFIAPRKSDVFGNLRERGILQIPELLAAALAA